MSAVALVSFRTPALAWTDSADDQRLFRRVTSAVLVITTVLCLALLLSPPPKPDRSQPVALPAPMAKMLLEHKPEPIPVTPKVEPPPQPEATPEKAPAKSSKPEPVKAETNPKPARANDQARPAAVLDAREPADNKPVVSEVDTARRRVAGLGLLAAKDDIAQVRGTNVAVQVKTDIRQGSGVGGGAASGGGSEPGSLARSMITSNAVGGSGGYATTSGTGSRTINGGGLASRATTVVEDAGARAAANNVGGTVKRGTSGKATRPLEDIRLVFERNKGAIYSIYNRALREDPTLQGKVMVELKIAPTGEVLACRVVSSDLHSPELEAKLVARIRQFDFGGKDVDQMVVNWPLDLLPS
ncbi:MAG: AgmX/PglI C-terminal domain-containing protein [Acidobacteriota bacterium]